MSSAVECLSYNHLGSITPQAVCIVVSLNSTSISFEMEVAQLKYYCKLVLYSGTPSAVRVGSETVTLMPPDALVLEVEATVYSAVSWLYNSTAMHDFPRLALEEFSKRLVLYNTTATDAGVYEADVYPIGEGPVQVIQFVVLPPPGKLTTASDILSVHKQYHCYTHTAMGTAPPNGSAGMPFLRK